MDVALLGVVAPGMENLSLRVLGGALADAGLEHVVVPFTGFAGMDAMIERVMRARPRVCGVSLQTTEALLATVTFTRMLRERGYTGTIVVGGHVATIAAEAILAVATGVDVVVELAGEQALVGLARGADPGTLPGTRTREGRGAPPIAVAVHRIRRERLGEHLGFGTADLVASRGCEAHCGYCCVAAVSALAPERRVALGPDAIADELAELVEQGARAFHVMDDNLLPLETDRALGWVQELRAALAARRVPELAFSLQLRGDVMTPALARALAELGLVRAYVGIDGYTQGHLRALGRSSPAHAGQAAIDALTAHGVLCVANALMIGPTLRYETVVDAIDGVARIRHAPVHLLPIEARPGTVYHRRASERGLIEGGPLWPVYRFEDERTFLVGEVLTGLPTRLLERSVPIALYDLAWALGVARRLAPGADVSEAAATYASVTAAWNADQVRVLRVASEAALHGRAAIADLLARELPFVRAHDSALLRAADAALTDVERAVFALHRRPVRAHARGRLLGSIAMAMGLASACGNPKHAAIDAPSVDAPLPACVDHALQSQSSPDEQTHGDCTCGETSNQQVSMTFDANGVVTRITDAAGNPLPGAMEHCLLALLAGYCYPSQAGTTMPFYTCHSWIA